MPETKRGRPPKPHTPRRTFRADDETWAVAEEKAKAAGLTVSEWLRRLIHAAPAER